MENINNLDRLIESIHEWCDFNEVKFIPAITKVKGDKVYVTFEFVKEEMGE